MHPVVFHICLIALTLCLGVTALLIVRSRSLTTRVLGLDTVTVILAAMLVLFGVAEKSSYYLDAALALALLGFAGTLVAVRYRAGKELY